MRSSLARCAILLLVACSSAAQRDESATSDVSEIPISLEVDVGRDSVRFALHLTNAGTQPLVLEFNTSQRYDFEVRTPAGAKVWQWSADQMFGQALGSETIPAGASRVYRASWAPQGRTGAFVAVGRVVARNQPIEQRAEFEIAR
ncbi:MAG: BsuPI-related putative proteinase inhibitor [Gemmatimonadota bacterium]